MFRCVCLPLLFLLLSGMVHADVYLSTTEESYVFPTSSPSVEEADTQASAVTTPGASVTTPGASVTTPGASVTTPGASVTTPGASVTTNGTTPAPTTHTNITTVAPTTNHTFVTTASPTNVTTITPTSNVTNVTTVVPTSNVTTTSIPAPTTTPLPGPFIGNYNVSNTAGLVCLKAKMGLQFSFKSHEGATFESVNVDPNTVNVSGICGSDATDATLMLMSDTISILFVFSNTTTKFFLSGLNFSVDTGSGNTFRDSNFSLSLWEASLGNSYMCRKEQSFSITDNLTLSTFELQVQPFKISNNKFSTAHECSLDDTSVLIPIIVGAALAGLILIVVIAYVIGRRKTYVGYQTL